MSVKRQYSQVPMNPPDDKSGLQFVIRFMFTFRRFPVAT